MAVVFDGWRGRVSVARSLGVDRWNDREEVLEFVVVVFGRRDGFIQWVEDRGVVRTKREFRDHMREVEALPCQWIDLIALSDWRRRREIRTAMIQMRRKLRIPMSSRRDMEIPLDLIPLQTAIDPTRVGLFPPTHPRALGELLAGIAPHLAQDMVHMRIRLLLRQP